MEKQAGSDSVWTLEGNTNRPFTIQQAADDIHTELEAPTQQALSPIAAPAFLADISLDYIGFGFTTLGPEATVDWKLSFPVGWATKPLELTDHVEVS